MADDSAGYTAGIWITPEDEQMLNEFDERFCSEHGESRSKHIKRAMRLAITVDKAYEAAPWSIDDERSLRANVRQAILNEISRETED